MFDKEKIEELLFDRYWYIKNTFYILLYMFAILPIYYVVAEHHLTETTLATPIDQAIPFVSFFAIPYVFVFYPFFIFTLGYYMYMRNDQSDRFFVSLLIVYAVAYLTYLIVNVKMIRPAPEELPKDFLSQVMARYYEEDPPYNCFPSLHAALSSLAAYHLSRDHKKYKYVFWGLAVWIMVATLFVRQHVIADEIAGFALAYVAGYLADRFVPERKFIEEGLMWRLLVVLVLGTLVTVWSIMDYIPNV